MTTKKEKTRKDDDVLALKAVDNLLAYALSRGAEAVSLEMAKDEILVSFNGGGDSSPVFNLSKKLEPGATRRIKELAGLPPGKNNLPSWGKFKKEFLGHKIIFSVFSKPAKEGERILIEIDDKESKLFSLKRLGFQRSALATVKRNLEGGRGGIVVMGDFDSGRTTTLYGFLDFLNKPEINVSTVENEINYDLPLINQSLLNSKKGFDYSFALSGILRQDPDVIMIDEINNRELAEKFLNIAERGHLVLAGAYSRNIFNYFDFLRDLGLSLRLFADNVKMVVNQRLAKRNCPYCVYKTKASQETIAELKSFFNFNDLMAKAVKNKIISNPAGYFKDFSFYRSRGCKMCGYKRYSGKIGVFEILEMTDNVGKLIKEGHLAKIKQEIGTQGGFSLAEDAFLKAANGIISLDEVLNITRNM